MLPAKNGIGIFYFMSTNSAWYSAILLIKERVRLTRSFHFALNFNWAFIQIFSDFLDFFVTHQCANVLKSDRRTVIRTAIQNAIDRLDNLMIVILLVRWKSDGARYNRATVSGKVIGDQKSKETAMRSSYSTSS